MAAKVPAKLPLERVPRHVAVIMDGNGRWAQRRGLPRTAGHRAGRENVHPFLEACVDFGIEYVTLYAFSTENWNRPRAEVRSLMDLFENITNHDLDDFNRSGMQFRHLGRLDGLSGFLQRKIRNALQVTKDNDRLIVNVALNYGGRAEIVDAVQRMIQDGVQPDQVTEDLISQYLYTAGFPDPDLVIRTAGEMRLSNFLIWQAAYAEYYSTPTYWPDFDREELYRALVQFSQRKRRFGQLDRQMEAK